MQQRNHVKLLGLILSIPVSNIILACLATAYKDSVGLNEFVFMLTEVNLNLFCRYLTVHSNIILLSAAFSEHVLCLYGIDFTIKITSYFDTALILFLINKKIYNI
jgi:hypothetical protein